MTRTLRRPRGTPARRQGITIIRFWMNGCGACEMSEDAWTEFEQMSPVKTVKIERAAIPPRWNSEIKAFPTYIVVGPNGKKLKKKMGAITDSAKLMQMAKTTRKQASTRRG